MADYLDLNAPPEHAGLAFVFGTRHAQPAHMAAGLFQRGIVEWIVLTGGSNRLTGLLEAQAHLEIVLAEGVPRERVVVESSSTNTLENVVLALPLLEERGLLQTLRSVVAVCKWYHCRRAVMTLKAHLPDGVRYYTQTYEPDDLRREGWQ
ncbi:MAG: YdcF family protein, partial [Anaerolineae bacterium]